jgi:hypothetical protein
MASRSAQFFMLPEEFAAWVRDEQLGALDVDDETVLFLDGAGVRIDPPRLIHNMLMLGDIGVRAQTGSDQVLRGF